MSLCALKQPAEGTQGKQVLSIKSLLKTFYRKAVLLECIASFHSQNCAFYCSLPSVVFGFACLLSMLDITFPPIF